MKEYIVLTGSYGSGKTELALYLSRKSAAERRKTLLVDLDLVNTYFRSSEHRVQLIEAGVALVAPNHASTNVEGLSLPAEVATAFHADWDTVIFDLGGDPAGAKAVGRFRRDFERVAPKALQVWCVVNVRRPFADTADRLLALLEGLERSTRLTVTGLVNNSNLAAETSAADLWAGYHILEHVSRRTGLPVVCTSGGAGVLDAFREMGPSPAYTGSWLPFTPCLDRARVTGVRWEKPGNKMRGNQYGEAHH